MHSYELDVDSSGFKKFVKRHKNGEETKVKIEKDGRGEWQVNVDDPRGGTSLGMFPSKGDAETAAGQWMSQHPKGVNSGMVDMFTGSGTDWL